MIRPVVILGVLCTAALAGCTPDQPPSASAPDAPFVEVQDWHTAAGHAKYYVTFANDLIVTRHDDFDSPITVLWRAALTPAQRGELARVWADIPAADLKADYTNPDVVDGQLVRFVYPAAAGHKTVEVWNTSEPHVALWVAALNRLLPPEHRIRMPEVRSGIYGRPPSK